MSSKIEYSEKYQDDKYEYRHVLIPKELAKSLPKNRLLSVNEWRAIGIQQSLGWEHYTSHRPEPHVVLFRRPLGTDPKTGEVNLELQRDAVEAYHQELSLHIRK
eukprot:gene17548-23111_t